MGTRQMNLGKNLEFTFYNKLMVNLKRSVGNNLYKKIVFYLWNYLEVIIWDSLIDNLRNNILIKLNETLIKKVKNETR